MIEGEGYEIFTAAVFTIEITIDYPLDIAPPESLLV